MMATAIQDRSKDDQERSVALPLEATLFSFGYKYGFPDHGNLILDVRCLPNPYWEEDMRHLTGLDRSVADYVLQSIEGHQFVELALPLMCFLVQQAHNQGKQSFTCGIGCTGGHHRSVAVVEFLAQELRVKGFAVQAEHRDIGKE